MENTPQVNALPSPNISGNNGIDMNNSMDMGDDYSAILFVIFIPILIYFIGKYIYNITRPEPEKEPFIDDIINLGNQIGDAFKKIEDAST